MSKQPKVNSPISVPSTLFRQSLLEQVQVFCETFNIPRYIILEHFLSTAMDEFVPTNLDVHIQLRKFIADDTNLRRDKWFNDPQVQRIRLDKNNDSKR